MHHILDLDRYPLHQPDSAAYAALVRDCQGRLKQEGMFNLDGLLRSEAAHEAVAEIVPVMGAESFTH